MKTEPDQERLVAVAAEFDIQPDSISPISTGNINTSFRVGGSGPDEFLLQQVNPLFARDVHRDIDSVTRHLQGKGLLTPRLIPTRSGSLFLERDAEIWRMFNYIPGIVRQQVSDQDTAFEAGALLARFHQALLDLDHRFHSGRTGVHDTPGHIQCLRDTLKRGRDHPRFSTIEPLGRDILELTGRLPALPATPARNVHGDPKITNILFDRDGGKAKCLIDFDTLGMLPLYLELGDALRSWSNPAGEDTTAAVFSLAHFAAAIRGYAGTAGEFIHADEWQAIVPATYVIYLELAARFCADAINESYFNWDDKRFNSHSEHNEIRARSQLHAALSMRELYQEAEKTVAGIFT